MCDSDDEDVKQGEAACMFSVEKEDEAGKSEAAGEEEP